MFTIDGLSLFTIDGLSKMKDFEGGEKYYVNDNELKKSVRGWLNKLEATEYAEDIWKQIESYNKCLIWNGVYVDKTS